jgi:hypothetical protein
MHTPLETAATPSTQLTPPPVAASLAWTSLASFCEAANKSSTLFVALQKPVGCDQLPALHDATGPPTGVSVGRHCAVQSLPLGVVLQFHTAFGTSLGCHVQAAQQSD